MEAIRTEDIAAVMVVSAAVAAVAAAAVEALVEILTIGNYN